MDDLSRANEAQREIDELQRALDYAQKEAQHLKVIMRDALVPCPRCNGTLWVGDQDSGDVCPCDSAGYVPGYVPATDASLKRREKIASSPWTSGLAVQVAGMDGGYPIEEYYHPEADAVDKIMTAAKELETAWTELEAAQTAYHVALNDTTMSVDEINTATVLAATDRRDRARAELRAATLSAAEYDYAADNGSEP
jgi:hypothetical protein